MRRIGKLVKIQHGPTIVSRDKFYITTGRDLGRVEGGRTTSQETCLIAWQLLLGTIGSLQSKLRYFFGG